MTLPIVQMKTIAFPKVFVPCPVTAGQTPSSLPQGPSEAIDLSWVGWDLRGDRQAMCSVSSSEKYPIQTLALFGFPVYTPRFKKDLLPSHFISLQQVSLPVLTFTLPSGGVSKLSHL